MFGNICANKYRVFCCCLADGNGTTSDEKQTAETSGSVSDVDAPDALANLKVSMS